MWKLKLDSEGKPVLNKEGHPIFVDATGKDVEIDVEQVATSARARAEQSQRVEGENKELKAKLEKFAGIEDPAAAIAALGTVKNLKDKQLVDAGEVAKVKDEAIKAVRAEYEPVVARNKELEGQLVTEKIGGAFSRSKFITEKMAIPFDMVQARFGGNFKIDASGKVVATGADGKEIFSRKKPGEIADFEESLEILVDSYEHKNHILKGTGAQGGGAGPSQGGGGGKTMTRAQFDALPPAEQKAAATNGTTFTD